MLNIFFVKLIGHTVQTLFTFKTNSWIPSVLVCGCSLPCLQDWCHWWQMILWIIKLMNNCYTLDFQLQHLNKTKVKDWVTEPSFQLVIVAFVLWPILIGPHRPPDLLLPVIYCDFTIIFFFQCFGIILISRIFYFFFRFNGFFNFRSKWRRIEFNFANGSKKTLDGAWTRIDLDVISSYVLSPGCKFVSKGQTTS